MINIKKISPYWACQISGWGLANLYWMYGMITCDCISFRNGFLNVLATFTTGILVTHVHALVIRKYKLHKTDFPKIAYHMVWIIISISFFLWIFNVYINYYSYKDNNYLLDVKDQGILIYAENSFDMFIAFARHAAIWVLTYFLFHFGKRSNEAEKEKAKLSQLYTESSLNHLKEQVNPHFMFNSLNSVKALINEDPEKAKIAIVTLADILRNSLNNSAKLTIPLREEIDQCRDYLKMEKIRFEDRLEYEINIAEEINHCALPPLSILTLVENAIKHGLIDSLPGGKITIDCRKEKDHIVTTVANDGKLKNKSKTGIGIENLKKQFAILYPQNFTFSIYEKEKKVIAEFKIPQKVSKKIML